MGERDRERRKAAVVEMPPVTQHLSDQSQNLFSPHTHSGTHIQAVTRCDLAVKDLVLDMKVSL